MPLFKGKSEAAFKHNVRTEMNAGKSQKQSLAIAYQMKRKKKMAKGGDVKGVHRDQMSKGKSLAGEIVRGAREGGKEKHQSMNELAKTLHEEKLEELKGMKGPHGNYAEGGEVDGPVSEEEAKKFAKGAGFADGGEVTCPHCTKTFSHGGQVANDDMMLADTLPNEFDDLVLDDDAPVHKYTGKDSGDEIGGPSKDDIVAKAMLKRKKK